jgi:phosphotransferase system  glucose/maltose/N-acetylglucosamine-specific IIC component
MSPEYGLLLFVIGMLVTVIFFMLLFWAMDDRPKTKNSEVEEDNAVVKFWKRYNSN